MPGPHGSKTLFEARNLEDRAQLEDAFAKIQKLFKEQNLPQLMFPEKIDESSGTAGVLQMLVDSIKREYPALEIIDLLRTPFTPCDVRVIEEKKGDDGVRNGILEIISSNAPPIILYWENWPKE